MTRAKLPHLLELKYCVVRDPAAKLSGVAKVRYVFVEIQAHLYTR